MTGVNIGETIYIPVETGAGPFAGEHIISFETLDGPVSGFIRHDQVINNGGGCVVEATVLAVEPHRIAVQLHGSFFTTTGLAHISHSSPYQRAA